MAGPLYRVFYSGPDEDHRWMPWDDSAAATFGAAVRRLRLAKGISQQDLAWNAGITKNQVQLIESGRGSGRRDYTGHSNPRMATVVGLAEALGVAPSELLAEAED